MNNSIEKILEAMTPDLYRRFQRAIEARKWPDGKPLTEQQLQTCMQAVIAYEHHNLAPEQRTGYVPPKTTACEEPPADDEQSLKWQ